jgi:hypothetical protein
MSLRDWIWVVALTTSRRVMSRSIWTMWRWATEQTLPCIHEWQGYQSVDENFSNQGPVLALDL